MFMTGLIVGISCTLLVTTLVLAFANGIPLSSPLHICVSIYLQIHKFWYRLTNNAFRITPQTVQSCLDLDKMRTVPYVRVLPSTKPSKAAQFWDTLMVRQKESTFVVELQKPYSPSRVSMLRGQMAFSKPMFTLYDRESCSITIESVMSLTKQSQESRHSIPIHVIQYEGSSMANGVILCFHGGTTVTLC